METGTIVFLIFLLVLIFPEFVVLAGAGVYFFIKWIGDFIMKIVDGFFGLFKRKDYNEEEN